MSDQQPFLATTSVTAFWQSPLIYSLSAALLVAMHIAGLVGLNWPFTYPLFIRLVPFNLLTTVIVVLLLHSGFDWRFVVFCCLTFIVGFGIEVAGVSTGKVFGHYYYGPVLGTKLWEVPLVIGCNWVTLIYCTGVLADKWLKNNLLKPVLGAMLMVAMDVWIEPVAMHLNFWDWQADQIPMQNYVAWFFVSLVLQVAFRFLVTTRNNPIASLVYYTQFVFFLGFNLVLLFR